MLNLNRYLYSQSFQKFLPALTSPLAIHILKFHLVPLHLFTFHLCTFVCHMKNRHDEKLLKSSTWAKSLSSIFIPTVIALEVSADTAQISSSVEELFDIVKMKKNKRKQAKKNICREATICSSKTFAVASRF